MCATAINTRFRRAPLWDGRVISRAELIELYEGQQLGLQRIGQIYGVSRHTVTRLARRYGVALRQPGRPYRV